MTSVMDLFEQVGKGIAEEIQAEIDVRDAQLRERAAECEYLAREVAKLREQLGCRKSTTSELEPPTVPLKINSHGLIQNSVGRLAYVLGVMSKEHKAIVLWLPNERYPEYFCTELDVRATECVPYAGKIRYPDGKLAESRPCESLVALFEQAEKSHAD